MTARSIQQALLAIVGFILFVRFGMPGIIIGGAWVADATQVTPLLDSEVRFLSALAVGLAIIIFWMIPHVERHTRLIQIISLTTLAGGLLRVLSVAQHGFPPRRALIATGIELILPVALLLAQRRLTARPGSAAWV